MNDFCWIVLTLGRYETNINSVHLSRETAEKAKDGLMQNLTSRDEIWKHWNYCSVMIKHGILYR